MNVDPPISPTSETFWDGTRERQLILQWCTTCDRSIHHPRARCPRCGNADLEWRPHDGHGRLHSWAVHPPAKDDDHGEEVMVAMVDLDAGPRMLTRLLGPTEDLEVDRHLRLCWLPLDDGRALPCFELANAASRR
ncbi:MAG: zinc ribbon domain-containing protein [Xanthomonadales bacterium]|nr:zinc ribbon domain-containing protein [Xanthomonadales bacterium]